MKLLEKHAADRGADRRGRDAVRLPAAGPRRCRRRSSRSTGVSVGYEADKPSPRARSTSASIPRTASALLGANGNGKSTHGQAARRIVCAPMGGRMHPRRPTGHRFLRTAPARRPPPGRYGRISTIRELMPDVPEAQVRARVGAMGFRDGQGGHAGVKSLSGGERRGCCSASLTFRGAAPDHPRRADQPSRHRQPRRRWSKASTTIPARWCWCLTDRHLLERCVDRLWLVADGTRHAL